MNKQLVDTFRLQGIVYCKYLITRKSGKKVCMCTKQAFKHKLAIPIKEKLYNLLKDTALST